MPTSFVGKFFVEMAGGQGFEPRQAESESAVLPLDDPPALRNDASKIEKSAYYVKGKS